MHEPHALHVLLTVEIHSSEAKDADWTTRVAGFSHALAQWLEAEGFDRLHQPNMDRSLFIARIEPPTRLGEAMEAAGALLKAHKIKNGAAISFEKENEPSTTQVGKQ